EIVDTHNVRVVASLDNRHGAWIQQLPRDEYSVRIHSISYREKEPGVAERIIEGGTVRMPPAGQTLLPNPALGFAGGGQIETDPRDEQGRVAKRNYYTVYVEPKLPAGASGTWVGPPGERVKVRFRLPAKPLLGQWAERLWWTIQEKVKI